MVSAAAYIHDSVGVPEGKLRVMGCYALVYILAGGGAYRDAGGGPHRVEAGDLILVFPDLPHTYGPGPDDRWDELHVLFEGEVFDLWRQRGLLDPRRPVLHLEPVSAWLPRLTRVFDPSASGRPALQVCRLQEVLAVMMEFDARGAGERASLDWVVRARSRLEQDLGAGARQDLAAVAGALGMSYEAFRKRYKRLTGEPPGTYRARCVMDLAARRLLEGKQTLGEIADALGFCDEFHFSKRFKQVTGLTPGAYRRRLPRA